MKIKIIVNSGSGGMFGGTNGQTSLTVETDPGEDMTQATACAGWLLARFGLDGTTEEKDQPETEAEYQPTTESEE